MALLNQVLEGVSDSRLLNDHREGPSPLRSLIKAYTEKAAHNDNAPNLTDQSTGHDLKLGISKLEPEDQMILLYDYLVGCKRIIPPECESEKEDRKLRHTAIRWVIATFCLMGMMLFGAVTSIAVHRGIAPSNEVVSTFLETAGEVAEFIFSKD